MTGKGQLCMACKQACLKTIKHTGSAHTDVLACPKCGQTHVGIDDYIALMQRREAENRK